MSAVSSASATVQSNPSSPPPKTLEQIKRLECLVANGTFQYLEAVGKLSGWTSMLHTQWSLLSKREISTSAEAGLVRSFSLLVEQAAPNYLSIKPTITVPICDQFERDFVLPAHLLRIEIRSAELDLSLNNSSTSNRLEMVMGLEKCHTELRSLAARFVSQLDISRTLFGIKFTTEQFNKLENQAELKAVALAKNPQALSTGASSTTDPTSNTGSGTSSASSSFSAGSSTYSVFTINAGVLPALKPNTPGISSTTSSFASSSSSTTSQINQGYPTDPGTTSTQVSDSFSSLVSHTSNASSSTLANLPNDSSASSNTASTSNSASSKTSEGDHSLASIVTTSSASSSSVSTSSTSAS